MATIGHRRLAEREHERKRDDSGRRAAWAFLWTLFVFKIATVGIIWWAATSTHSTELDFIVATTWYWFLIPIVAISGPLVWRWRLIQMRRRRDQLRGAEWMEVHRRKDTAPGTTTIEDILYEYERRDRKSA